jgi:hypothetical protein
MRLMSKIKLKDAKMRILDVIEKFIKGGIKAQQEVNKVIAKGKEVQITPMTVLIQRRRKNGRYRVRIFNVHKQIENAIKKDSFLKYRIDYLMGLPHKKRFPTEQINAIAKQAGITRTQVHNYVKKQRANRNKANKPVVNGELFYDKSLKAIEEKEKTIAG